MNKDGYLMATCIGSERKGNGKRDEVSAIPFNLSIGWKDIDTLTHVQVTGSLDMDLGESFCALVDLKVTVGHEVEWSVGNLWPNDNMKAEFEMKRRREEEGREEKERIEISYRVKMMSKTDLTVQSGFRTFRILCASRSWFVDIVRLQSYGPIFSSWKDKMDEGTSQVVSHEDPSDMQIVLEALQAYDQPLIHRTNYLCLLILAERFKAHPLLRHIEDFLLESHLHPMRSLELATCHRLARLYDLSIKQLGPPMKALEILHEYLESCGSSMEDLHPALLSVFKISSRSIVI